VVWDYCHGNYLLYNLTVKVTDGSDTTAVSSIINVQDVVAIDEEVEMEIVAKIHFFYLGDKLMLF